mgnify:CR=1 FL=1
MRIILGLNLVSSQPLFSVGVGNLPETYGANKVRKENLLSCYRNIGKGCLPVGYQYHARRAGEPVLTERKHIRQFTLTYYFR